MSLKLDSMFLFFLFISLSYSEEQICCRRGIKSFRGIQLCNHNCCLGLEEFWAENTFKMVWCDKSQKTKEKERKFKEQGLNRGELIEKWYRRVLNGVRFG